MEEYPKGVMLSFQENSRNKERDSSKKESWNGDEREE